MKSFKYNNLLVTGGCGFIGSNFIDFIFNNYRNVKIYNLDKLTYAGSIDNTKKFNQNINYKLIIGDICDNELINSVFEKYHIDGVVNFAAETHVDNSIIDPDKFIKTNINGVFVLLNCCYKNWMKSPFIPKNNFNHSRFHQISTDEIYGSRIKGSFLESDKFSPNSPYSASKASADLLVRSFTKTYGLNTTISVSSNNFGLNQHSEKFIPKIIEKIIAGESIPVYGDGNNIRDWIYVLDNCIAIDNIFQNSQTGESYNVGAGNELSNLELIEIIYAELGTIVNRKKKIKFVKDRYGHDFRYSINSNKIKIDLGWSIKYDFKTSIQDYINKYIGHHYI